MNTTVYTTIDQYCCASCGVLYGLEYNYAKRKSDDNGNWYCPNGHSQVFRESAIQRAEKTARRAQELLALERSQNQSLRGQVTRLKNRAAAGVCPCCTRTFRQLAAHMKTKHPDYVEPVKEGGK